MCTANKGTSRLLLRSTKSYTLPMGWWSFYQENKSSLKNYLGFSFSAISNYFCWKVEFSVITKYRKRVNHCVKRKKLNQAAPSLGADLNLSHLDVSNFIRGPVWCKLSLHYRFLGAREVLNISLAYAVLLPLTQASLATVLNQRCW